MKENRRQNEGESMRGLRRGSKEERGARRSKAKRKGERGEVRNLWAITRWQKWFVNDPCSGKGIVHKFCRNIFYSLWLARTNVKTNGYLKVP